MSATTVSNHPELSLSSLSLESCSTDDLDWDRSQTDIDPYHPSIPQKQDQDQRVRGDMHLTDRLQQRSLVDLLRLRAQKSKGGDDALKLTPSEEQALEEELGRWINSDSSPYEGDKKPCRPASFAAPRRQRSTSPNGRPRSSTLDGHQKEDDSTQIPPRRNRQATRPAADENAARTFRTTRSKPAQAVSTSTSVVTNTTVNKDATASRTDTVASAAKRKREALGEVTNKNKSRQTGLKGDAGDSKDKAIPVKKPAPSALTTVTGARIPLGERKPLHPASTRHVRGSSTTEKEGEVAQDGAEDAMTVDAQDQRPIRTSRRLITRTTTVATSTSTLRSQPSVTAHGQSRRLASTTSSKNAGSIAATSRTRTSLSRRSTQTNPPEESVEDPKPAHKKRRTSSVGPEGDIPLQDGGDEEARFALPVADVEPSVEPKEGESQGALKASWDDLDKEDADDPQMVSEYVAEIFQYLLKLEITTMPNPRYMENQGELAWRMRGILTDWLIQIHGRFRLLPETLFLTINIIDRFLSSRVVSLVKLQLVGITSLFIAAKYEEIMAPSVANFLACADGNYNEKNILEAEKYILRTLDWNMSYPNPIHFLRRASKADGYDLAVRTVAKYFVEIALLEHRLLVATPSATAAAAIWLARLVLDKEEWNPNLVHYSGYTEADIVPVARLMLNYVLKPTRHENFFKKYAARKFMKASVFVHSWARDRWEEGTIVDLAAELPELRRASQARRDAGQAAGQLAEDDCLVVY